MTPFRLSLHSSSVKRRSYCSFPKRDRKSNVANACVWLCLCLFVCGDKFVWTCCKSIIRKKKHFSELSSSKKWKWNAVDVNSVGKQRRQCTLLYNRTCTISCHKVNIRNFLLQNANDDCCCYTVIAATLLCCRLCTIYLYINSMCREKSENFQTTHWYTFPWNSNGALNVWNNVNFDNTFVKLVWNVLFREGLHLTSFIHQFNLI